MRVIKRNGKLQDFDISKVLNAVDNTFKSFNKDMPDRYKEQISNLFENKDVIGVEEIQDKVETFLMKNNNFKAAKAFILYRERHKKIREFADKKLQFIETFKKSDNTANATIDDNSNVSTHNMGVLNTEIHKEDNRIINIRLLRDKLKELYPNFDYKQMDRDFESIMYLHDSSSQIGMPYCVAISLYPFLLNGLKDIGGLSAAPKNIDSFCGMFVNLVFAIAGQFKGACLYKDQKLLINENGIGVEFTAKDLVEKYLVNSATFSNFQGDWEVALVPNGIDILEDGKCVPIRKVYRRKYNDKIYKITTDSGHIAYVSKDHVFKQLYRTRNFETKASQLEIGDTVHVNYDYSSIINNNSYDFKRGWLIGIICGDGCISKENSISLSVNYNQEYLGDIFNDYSKEIFGYALNKNKGHKCWNYQKYNKEYYISIHEDIIGNTAYDKHIELSNKSIDYITGFLDGLFCSDGSYSESHGITICLTNKNLANNIHDALKVFGIENHICIVSPIENRKESYQQYISSKILKYLKHAHLKVLSRGCKNIQDSSREIYYYGRNALKFCNSNKRASWGKAKWDIKYNTDTIKSIEIIDNDDEYVYEIETDSHWYNCGGFITHNCATPGLLVCMDYYLRKEWGDNYYLKKDMIISSDCCIRKQTIHKQIHQYFQQICYTLMQPSGSRGHQAVFWNLSIFDKPFFDTMYGDFYYPDGNKAMWESVNWLQKDFLHWLNQERLKCILTFPVVSGCLIYQNGEFLDKELAEYFAKEYAEGNSFFTYISDSVDSLSSCCRLSSKIAKPQFNFTNGQLSEMTGSKNVITLNVNRIVQDFCRENMLVNLEGNLISSINDIYKWKEDLKKYLIKILERVYKYQTAYNELLKELYDAGLLSVYKAGFIDMKRQYLTIGINGLNQAAEFLGMKCNKNEYYKQFCNLVFSTIKEQNMLHKTKELMFNTEFTPCESAAIKLYNKDKEDGYWVPNDTNLYASYVYKPNDPDISLLDKIYLHGNEFCGDYLDGGSSAHLNLDSHLSVEQYRKILKYAAETGCKYFTFNVPNCECEDCGFIAKQPFNVCPKCESTNVSLWDRVIGYLTKIKNWSAGRQKEQKTRVYQHIT